MFQPPFSVWRQNVQTATRDGIRPNTEGVKLLTDYIKQALISPSE